MEMGWGGKIFEVFMKQNRQDWWSVEKRTGERRELLKKSGCCREKLPDLCFGSGLKMGKPFPTMENARGGDIGRVM